MTFNWGFSSSASLLTSEKARISSREDNFIDTAPIGIVTSFQVTATLQSQSVGFQEIILGYNFTFKSNDGRKSF